MDAIKTLTDGPSLQEFVDRIDYKVVPDNTLPDSYDSALAGAQFVIHVAGVWPTPVSVLMFLSCFHVLSSQLTSPTCRASTPTTISTFHSSNPWKMYCRQLFNPVLSNE